MDEGERLLMIPRPYHVRLGDHAGTIVLRDVEERDADAAAKRLSIQQPDICVHVVHRDCGIVRSYEAGQCLRRS